MSLLLVVAKARRAMVLIVSVSLMFALTRVLVDD